MIFNPFEAAIYGCALAVGATGLVQGSPSTSTLATIWPGWAIILYYVALFIGGVMALLGMIGTHRGPTRSKLILWQAGLISIASAWGTYGLALFTLGPIAGLTAAFLLSLVALAAVYRWVQIRKLG